MTHQIIQFETTASGDCDDDKAVEVEAGVKNISSKRLEEIAYDYVFAGECCISKRVK